MVDTTPQTLAAKIRILAESGVEADEIASQLEADIQYVWWVLWAQKNKTKRRAWEAKYRKEQYGSRDDVRERTLARQANKRARNHVKGRP